MRTRLHRTALLLVAAVLATAAFTTAPAQDAKKAAKGAVGTVFELYQDKSGDYRFRIKSGDAILAISGKGYGTKAACEKVISTLKKEAAKAKIRVVPKEKK